MSKHREEPDDGPKIEMIVDRQFEGLRRWMVMVSDLCARYDYPIPGRVRAFLAWYDHEFSDAGPGSRVAGGKASENQL
jgi:hypothetical protein